MYYGGSVRRRCVLLLLIVMAWSTAAATYARPVSDSWPVDARGEEDLDAVRVTMIQYLLRQHGYSVIVDGKYGSQTQKQVSRFQRARHLQVTGTVGSPTWRALILPLHRGQQGNAVLAAQMSLSQWVDDRLPLDGRFGRRTELALRLFQRQNGLHEDGIVSPATWMRLTDTYGD